MHGKKLLSQLKRRARYVWRALTRHGLLRLVLLIALTLQGSTGCDPGTTGLTGLGIDSAVNGLRAAIADLDAAVDKQRANLKADTIEVLETARLESEKLAGSAAILTGALEQRTAADVRAMVSETTTALNELTRKVKTGADDSVKRAAQEVSATLHKSHAVVRDTVESTRPLIAQAKAAGGQLVWQTEGALSTLLVRSIAGALFLLSAVTGTFMAMRTTDKRARVARSLVALVPGAALGIGLFLYAPRVAALTATTHSVTDHEQKCRIMEQQGPQLMSLRSEN
ncbi:MAG TPA: hypothetical protein VFU02_07185, partial [Polyangiaceae bacterium]|nr:hypothetical protein [Polyangiaceae bacterium]